MSKTRDVNATKEFLCTALGSKHNQKPRVITIDKYAATIKAMKTSPYYEGVKHRNSKYMNNIIEQDHRRIKRKTNLTLGFKSFDTTSITIAGIELFQMLTKNQIESINTVLQEVKFIERLFVKA